MFETHELEVKTTPEHNQSIISSNLPVCLITTCISTIISADMLSFFSVIILFLKMCGIWWHDEALTSHTVTHLLNTSPLLKADFNLAQFCPEKAFAAQQLKQSPFILYIVASHFLEGISSKIMKLCLSTVSAWRVWKGKEIQPFVFWWNIFPQSWASCFPPVFTLPNKT